MTSASTQAESQSTRESHGVLSIERRPDGVAILRMDDPLEAQNTLKASFAEDFGWAIDTLSKLSDLRGVVFTSGKPDTFLAGANLDLLSSVKTTAEAEALSKLAQAIQARFRTIGAPVVAAIHGAALGGGLEITLACHARIASDDRRTVLGLPEVQLGLIPAGGGTQRLPRLIGVQKALDLLLTGKQLRPAQAKRIGLVDEVVPQSILLEVAIARALDLSKTHLAGEEATRASRRPKASAEALQALALEGNAIGRALLFREAKKKLLAKTRGNYPAAERILEAVRIGLADGFEAGLAAEARFFGELVPSREARALIGIFFATTALKKDKGTDAPDAEARRVEKVAMVGGGLMGGGIAYVTAATAKIPVRVKDRDDAGVGRGLAYVREILDGRARKRAITSLERDEIMARVTGGADYEGFARADIVIEAVFEDLALKHRVLAEVEAVVPGHAIFASNTSSIPIAEIARGSRRPSQVIGMHYFSPVHKMPLLEIIVLPETAPWVTATAVELGKKQGKTVIVVRDGAGFYTSRILAPYVNEAAYLLAEGARVDEIDQALVDFGFPVGPLTLLDEVGIDVATKVAPILHKAFGDRMQPPAGFERLVADGRAGKKNARGFYDYAKKGKGKRPVDESIYHVLGVVPASKLSRAEIAERCALTMVNEAARCLEDGILRSARDGDIGAVFGLGFPPFRGGPFRYVDEVGASRVVEKLEALERKHGARFRPAPRLVEAAKRGAPFYESSQG